MNKKRILNIVLLLLSMIVIFLFSNEDAKKSDNTSKSVTEKIIIVTNQGSKNDSDFQTKVDRYDVIVRKVAHAMEYLLFGILLINVLKDYKALTIKIVIMAIVLSMIYAFSDELHQLFISGRSMQMTDVLIDTCSASFGIILFYLMRKRYSK